jgi:hypothetical protein
VKGEHLHLPSPGAEQLSESLLRKEGRNYIQDQPLRLKMGTPWGTPWGNRPAVAPVAMKIL